jgi:hypothetical protein
MAQLFENAARCWRESFLARRARARNFECKSFGLPNAVFSIWHSMTAVSRSETTAQGRRWDKKPPVPRSRIYRLS